MINKTLEDLTYLIENWGTDGIAVFVACYPENFNDSFDHFLDHCYCCGGNWGGMLLSGIRELYPAVYAAIPNKMGPHAFECICKVLVLLGVKMDTAN